MSHRQVEDIRMVARLTRRRLRKIVFALAIDLHIGHGMIDQQLSERDFMVEDGLNLQPDGQRADLQ